MRIIRRRGLIATRVPWTGLCVRDRDPHKKRINRSRRRLACGLVRTKKPLLQP